MERIIEVDTSAQHQKNMAMYAIEVNRKRISPDVRDGLKTVQRRIIDLMFNDLPCATRKVKTAKVVGGVIGKSHPHGDSSVGDAIKPMTNWWEKKCPLIFSDTNTGSMQGDRMAAPRYTEVMLSKFCVDTVIAEMATNKNVVDWVPTFDFADVEPEYFPVAVPLLLINGVSGIGVGMVSNIPPHNLCEVIDATINLIKDPSYPVVLIPDMCMPCEIIDTNWKKISNTGSGKYIARAIIDIEQRKNGDQQLVIKSTPDQVSYDKGEQNGGVKYKILELISSGRLSQITKIDEESHGNNMRIVLHLRKGTDANFVREALYRETDLQNTYNVNFEVLCDTDIKRFSYKSYLQSFIEQRKTIKFRLACMELQKVRTRIHEIDAYIKVWKSGEIDNIIQMIKSRKSTDESATVEYLIKKCKLTDIQAKFIIKINLTHLSEAYIKKYEEELSKLLSEEVVQLNKIENESIILNEIMMELLIFKEKYGEPRKCRVISKKDVVDIPKGTFKIVITENNFIKKLNPEDNITSIRGDKPKHVLIVENTDNLLLFSSQGKVFKLPINKIPITEKGGTGSDSRILIKGLVSDICSVIYEPTLIAVSKKLHKHSILIVTRGNFIKRIDLSDLLSVPPSGIIYTKLNSGDFVKEVMMIPDGMDIIIYSWKKALRISVEEIPKYRRSTIGVTAMNLSNGEFIDGVSGIYPNMTDMVVITESGRFNRIKIDAFKRSSRAKSGSAVIKLGKSDIINSIFGVSDGNIIHVVTKNTTQDVNINNIPYGSSLSTGTKVIPMKNDMIIKCTVTNS